MTDYWSTPTYLGEPDPIAHTGFILAEDAALKTYLSGMTVPDRVSTSDVPVWFRYPEGERRMMFPFITIDLIGVNPSYERWQSIHRLNPMTEVEFQEDGGTPGPTGLYQPSVSPTLVADTDNTPEMVVDNYLMYELLYQVTVHSRSALHDRVLWSRFMTDIFPPRPFWVGVDADMTWRRCELREVVQADTMETTESGSKRIFRKIHTISMDAEIPQNKVAEIERVWRIHVDMYTDDAVERETPGHAYDATHLIAAEEYTTTPDYIESAPGSFPSDILLQEPPETDPILQDVLPPPGT